MIKSVLKSPLGGLLLGFFVFYIWPEVISSHSSKKAIYKSDNFIIHYSKQAPFKDEIPKFAVEQEKILQRLIDFLKLKRKSIPDEIHIYLYDNIQHLKSGISQRKSSSEFAPLALVDIIWGADTYGPLALLVMEFSLGKPSSKILQKGLATYFSDTSRHFYTETAALVSTQFLSLEQMLQLGKVEQFPQQLHEIVFEKFDSPKAKASLGLGTLRQLISISQEEPSHYLVPISAETASLAKFLIDEWGIKKFKELWQYDSFRHGVEKLYGISLRQLENKWKKHSEREGQDDPRFKYLQGVNLFNAGKFQESRRYLETAVASMDSQQNINRAKFKLGILDFYTYQFVSARNLFKEVNPDDLPRKEKKLIDSYIQLIDHYSSGTIGTSKDITIVNPTSKKASSLTAKGQKVYTKALEILKLDRKKLPDRIIAFIKPNENSSNSFQELRPPQGVLLIKLQSTDLGYRIIKLLSEYIGSSLTYSNLLKEGLAHYLGHPDEDYFKEASLLMEKGRWIPLEQLIFGPSTTTEVNTEAAAFVGYLLARYDPDKFVKIWIQTSPFGGDYSLMTAVEDVYEKPFSLLQQELREFLTTES